MPSIFSCVALTIAQVTLGISAEKATENLAVEVLDDLRTAPGPPELRRGDGLPFFSTSGTGRLGWGGARTRRNWLDWESWDRGWRRAKRLDAEQIHQALMIFFSGGALG